MKASVTPLLTALLLALERRYTISRSPTREYYQGRHCYWVRYAQGTNLHHIRDQIASR